MLRTFSILGLVAFPLCCSRALELPQVVFEQLGSPSFRERESAEESLLGWSRSHGTAAMSELLNQSRVAADPEVRSRCLSVLKLLVTDQYMKEGEGFVGIALKDEEKAVPGDPKMRRVIRILQVQVGSPGEKAGLQVNDLLVAMDQQVWYDDDASPVFREKILELKPGTEVGLQVLRNKRLENVRVVLGRKPISSAPLVQGFHPDLEALERAAMDAYFQRWLRLNPLPK